MPINVTDWSETPGSNTTIDGVNIAEDCSPAALNNMGRAIMAGVKTFHVAYTTSIGTLGNYMPKAAGSFSGTQPIYAGEGAMLHHASSANVSGKVHILAEGAARPASPANGDMVWYYAP